MSEPTILFHIDDNVAILTLNRPEKLNAFTPEMARRFIELLDKTDSDDAVKAVIVTGAGRAFCAGADLSAGGATFDPASASADTVNDDGSLNYSAEALRDFGGRVSLRIYNSQKPIIAALNGPAVGVGITMTLAMDIRLASSDSKAGFVFTRRAIVPEAASSFFLPRLVGISRALEWCYSGRMIDSQELRESGLCREILAPEDLLERAMAIAREIVENTAPVSVALTRQMLWRGLEMQHPMEAHRLDSRVVAHRGRSSDAREGVESFFEKRKPQFSNRVSQDMPDFFPWWDEPEYR